ncbi:ferrous iron transport protein A [Phenylobacterium sp.]|uniref:FeoA family protein n=1 Tax=Phenylobacterium sp. TaxID=1871053 RepID=UPI0035B4BCEC
MNDMFAAAAALEASAPTGAVVRLSEASPGDCGVIIDVRAESHPADHGVDVLELQRRLLEFGFVEGARVAVIHEGAIRRDPIAVRLDDMRVALRRRDAEDVWVLLDTPRS